MTGGNTPERGRQSGGRALGAFSWTSSYWGGGVKGSMEGGGTFLSGRLILKSLRWSFSDLILRTFSGFRRLANLEFCLSGGCPRLPSASALGVVGLVSSSPVRDSYEGREMLILGLWSGSLASEKLVFITSS